jgi:protein SCO1/2
MKKAALILLTTILLALIFYKVSTLQKSVTVISGEIIQGGSDIADFNLRDINGQAFSKESLKGKWSIIYLGFTQCPDACPTAMGYFKGELNSLNAENMKSSQFLMVTVDPERDNETVLKDYTSSFHKDLNALTGDIADIKALAKSLHTHFHKEGVVSDDLYMMAHSPRYYLVDPNARLYASYQPPVEAGQLAKDLSQLIKEGN